IVIPRADTELFFPYRNKANDGFIFNAAGFGDVYRLTPLLTIADLQDNGGIAVDGVALVSFFDERISTFHHVVDGQLPLRGVLVILTIFNYFRIFLPAFINNAVNASGGGWMSLVGVAE